MKLKKKRMMRKEFLVIKECNDWLLFMSRQHLLGIAMIALVTSPVFGQEVFTKKFDEVFESTRLVTLDHKNGPLTVLPSKDGKIKLVAEISFIANNVEDSEILFDHFKIISDQYQDQLNLQTSFDIKSWSTSRGRTRLIFSNGKRVENIKDLSIKVELFLPEIDKLKLSQKYGPIVLGKVPAKDLFIKLYDGQLSAQEVRGKLNLVMKYSKAELENINHGEFTLLDSKVYGKDCKTLTLDSKYSKVQLGAIKMLELIAHDDKFEFESIDRFIIQDKYSDFLIGRFDSGRMDIHDSSVTIGKGGSLKMKSKYSNIEINQLQNLDIELSYDDNLDISNLNSIVAESKYTDFKIGSLGSKCIITSYDDNVEIGQMTGPLEGIEFNGKYTDFFIEIPSNTKYLLEANITYGKFIFPEKDIEKERYIVKNEKMDIKGKVKGSIANSPKIVIVSYDGKIYLK